MQSELDTHFKNKNGNLGQWCARYNLKITGCSRYFVCMEAGVKACMEIFTPGKKAGIKIATTENTLKQIGFSVKQGMGSVKMHGVGRL